MTLSRMPAKESPRNILLLSPGNKVALTRIARIAANARGCALFGVDTWDHLPTSAFLDRYRVIDSRNREIWIQTLLQLCSDENIGLVIPTRHSDLIHLSKCKGEFESNGTAIALSAAETLSICLDKRRTADHFERCEVGFPKAVDRAAIGADSFPLFAKDPEGAGSLDCAIVDSRAQLEALPHHWILQERAAGREYTVNIYVDRAGNVRSAIPHRRIVVENGEVTQARTERIPSLIDQCERVASALPNAWGPLNIQAFYQEETDSTTFIEINPRIGGGYPLADQAKGHFIEWLCREALDDSTLDDPEPWTEKLLMLRYREAVFIKE